MPEKFQDELFLEFVVKALVTKPEAVKVVRSTDEMGVMLSLYVDREDMGLVIGKDGTTAKAIRTLIRPVGMRSNARVSVRIVEPEGSGHVPKHERKNRSVDDVVGDLS